MELTYYWAMPNTQTFKIKPIKDILREYVLDGEIWIDPFAGNNSPANITNDQDKEKRAIYHLEAIEFINSLKGKYDGVLFDPPYSYHQACINYKGFGKRIKSSLLKDLISNKIKKGGFALSFGWNSNGFGKKRGFEKLEIILISHGGEHNDTIITIEKKQGGV